MKCDKCDKEATVHLTQVINGEMQKLHLCAECAQSLGVSPSPAFSVSDILLGSAVPEKPAEPKSLVCDECDTSLQNLQKQGRLGCPRCYGVFRPNVLELLESMHSATQHVGSVPARFQAETGSEQQQIALREALADAVAREDYEQAARLRDQLVALEAEI